MTTRTYYSGTFAGDQLTDLENEVRGSVEELVGEMVERKY